MSAPDTTAGKSPPVAATEPLASGSLPPVAPITPTRSMIVTLGLVAALCGLIIVGAYEGSLPSVRENRRIAVERAIHKVLPGARKIASYHALATGGIQPAGSADPPAGALSFHAAWGEQGQLLGIAAEGSGKGYADVVKILFGYSPACSCVVGLSVVAMRETPGIGDKIITDLPFQANFRALDARLSSDLKALANEVRAVKHGTKTQAWQIDAIAGATITSRAVGRAINDAAQVLLPRLVPNLGQLEKVQ